jgi:hypothetical protein
MRLRLKLFKKLKKDNKKNQFKNDQIIKKSLK